MGSSSVRIPNIRRAPDGKPRSNFQKRFRSRITRRSIDDESVECARNLQGEKAC
jgi:hypothetical protein